MSLNSQSKEIKHQVSGGFKIPFDLLTKNNPIKTSEPVTKQTDNKNISHLLTKSEILQQVGLNPNTKDLDLPIDFEDLKEKGIYGLKSKKDIADAVIKDIEKKIEKIKNGRSEMQQKLLEKRKRKEELAAKASKDDVIIFDGDERKQYASHILSTLEVHSVENVEALIVKNSKFSFFLGLL